MSVNKSKEIVFIPKCDKNVIRCDNRTIIYISNNKGFQQFQYHINPILFFLGKWDISVKSNFIIPLIPVRTESEETGSKSEVSEIKNN